MNLFAMRFQLWNGYCYRPGMMNSALPRLSQIAGLSAALLLGLAAQAPSALANGSTSIVYIAVGNGVGTNPYLPLGGSNPIQYGQGGAFTAILSNTSLYNSVTQHYAAGPVPYGYASQATGSITSLPVAGSYSAAGQDGGGSVDPGDAAFLNDKGFETFCLEDNINYYPGNYYDYSLGLSVQQTGAGVNGSVTALTSGAAWLYEQYSENKLGASAYTLAGSGEIQATLWYLQGQPDEGGNTVDYYSTVTPNSNYNDVIAKFGTLGNAQKAVTTATEINYGVQVLELTNPAGSGNGAGQAAQDQLIFTGVPDGGATVGLLGVGLLVLAIFGFRRKVAA